MRKKVCVMKPLNFKTIVFGFLILVSTSAVAQENVLGDWYGVLKTPQGDIPLVLIILEGEDGSLNGYLESPSQAPRQETPITSISIMDGHLSFASNLIGAAYKGDWDQAGQHWSGVFTQGLEFPLIFTKGKPEAEPGVENGALEFAFSFTEDDEAFAKAISDLAGELLEVYEEKKRSTYLFTLFRLHLTAGHFAAAEDTLLELEELWRTTQSRPPETLIGWRVYARAKKEEQLTGKPLEEALDQAFSDLFSTLDDKRAIVARVWLEASLERAENDFEAALEAHKKENITVDDALNLVRRYQFFETWSYLLPRVGPLLEADLDRRFIVEDDILIQTPDGVTIATLVIRPRSVEQPLVALLNFTIYADDNWSFSDAIKMAAYGYAGVVAYSRGKGRSPDTPVPYEHDGDDARAVINWVTQQSWSDGRVGMYSGSYNTFTQWSTAKDRPEALKAIATSASNAPGIDTPMQGNIFQNFVYPWPFFVTKTKGLAFDIYSDAKRWNKIYRDWYLSGKPYRNISDFDVEPNPVFSKWLEHPSYDAYWQDMLPYKEEFADIDIPVFVSTGYFDGGMIGALYYMRQHLKYNPEADHRMIIGPYGHLTMQTGVLPLVEGYKVDPVALVDLQEIRLGWFDHIFKGTDLPSILSDTVNFQVMGANIWRHAPSLEAMGEETVRFYLSDEQNGEVFPLSNLKPEKRGSTELVVDLTDRSDVDYQVPASFPGLEIDTRNAVVFESAPISDVSEVDGFFSATLKFVTNKKDFDLNISLYEKLPTGEYFPLAYYIGRASYMKNRSKRHLLKPGKRMKLFIESEWLTARKLEPGGRIVAVIGVLKQPGFQVNYGTGKDVSDESIADAGEPLNIKWLNTSFIELQIRR